MGDFARSTKDPVGIVEVDSVDLKRFVVLVSSLLPSTADTSPERE